MGHHKTNKHHLHQRTPSFEQNRRVEKTLPVIRHVDIWCLEYIENRNNSKTSKHQKTKNPVKNGKQN